VPALGWVAIIMSVLMVVWAGWLDRHREVVGVGAMPQQGS